MKKSIGIILIIAGILGFVLSSVTFTTTEQVADVGPGTLRAPVHPLLSLFAPETVPAPPLGPLHFRYSAADASLQTTRQFIERISDFYFQIDTFISMEGSVAEPVSFRAPPASHAAPPPSG